MEQSMEFSVVFKVKYGDTLRRFNVQLLYLHMEGLRAKISSLFNFPPGAGFTMTYVDEDQDVVTIGDYEDLCDIVKQGLNPVRINVQLIDDEGSSLSARSCGNSTSLTSSEVHGIHSSIHNGAAEAFKSVPEPPCETLPKVSLDVASKDASSFPVLAELVNSLMEATSFTESPSVLNNATNDGSQKAIAPNSKGDSNSSKECSTKKVPDARKMAKFVADFVTTMELENLSGKVKRKGKKKGKDGNSGVCSNTSKPPKHEKVSSSGRKAVDIKECSVDVDSAYGTKHGVYTGTNLITPSSLQLPGQLHLRGAVFHRGVRCDGCGMFPITGPRFKSTVEEDYDLCYVCFCQLRSVNNQDYVRIDVPAHQRNPWSKELCEAAKQPTPPSFKRDDALDKSMNMRSDTQLVKKKVANPIRLDNRFIADVNVLDGTIMPPEKPFTKIWRMCNNGKDPWPLGTQLLWIAGDKFSDTDAVEMKLPLEGLPVDSEFEVAVDFTSPQAPGRYISYWTMASPSGQKFGQRIWVLIQVELDASLADLAYDNDNYLNLNLPPVDFQKDPKASTVDIAPLVNICCDPVNPAKVKDPKVQDLNLPCEPEVPIPVTTTITTRQFPSGWDQQMFLSYTIPPFIFSNSVACTEILETSSSAIPQAVSYPPVNSSTLGNAPATIPPSVSCTPVDSGIVGRALAPADSYSPSETLIIGNNKNPSVVPPAGAAVPNPAEHARGGSSENVGVQSDENLEESLLKELEEMGFTEVDLNREILRINKYDLEQSVKDLCDYADSDWDPLLEELQEMGFHDEETNKRLLVKNNGSLKRVVLDLVVGEADQKS
ncbi:hypothetical protein Dimus_004689 [Dionaea muscipula]